MIRQNYIKNKGSTQTIIQNGNENPIFNNIHWNANYDGKDANIDVDINDNGDDYKIKAKLDNRDLAQLFNVPAIKGDLNRRLQTDFLSNDVSPMQMQMPIIEAFSDTGKITPKILKVFNNENENNENNENNEQMALQELMHLFPAEKSNEIIFKPEKLRPELKFQPFLRPKPLRLSRIKKIKKNRKTINNIAKRLKAGPSNFHYRTPSPETLRIHLTPATAPTKTKKKLHSVAQGLNFVKHKKHNKTKKYKNKQKFNKYGFLSKWF